MLAAVRLGEDPTKEKAERPASLTVSELIDFFDARYIGPMLKPETAIGDRIALEELCRAHGALKSTALTRSHVATLHFCMAGRPYAGNRAVAVWSKAFVWAAGGGLFPEGKNPVKNIKKYREQGRECLLTSEELARLGDVLQEGETVGLPYSVDETESNSEAHHEGRPSARQASPICCGSPSAATPHRRSPPRNSSRQMGANRPRARTEFPSRQ